MTGLVMLGGMLPALAHEAGKKLKVEEKDAQEVEIREIRSENGVLKVRTVGKASTTEKKAACAKCAKCESAGGKKGAAKLELKLAPRHAQFKKLRGELEGAFSEKGVDREKLEKALKQLGGSGDTDLEPKADPREALQGLLGEVLGNPETLKRLGEAAGRPEISGLLGEALKEPGLQGLLQQGLNSPELQKMAEDAMKSGEVQEMMKRFLGGGADFQPEKSKAKPEEKAKAKREKKSREPSKRRRAREKGENKAKAGAEVKEADPRDMEIKALKRELKEQRALLQEILEKLQK